MTDDTFRRIFNAIVIAAVVGFAVGALAAVGVLTLMQQWGCPP